MRINNRFLADFETHLKTLLLENGSIGECYLQSAYAATAFKALKMNPQLVAGRFGVKNSGVSIPHAWVIVDGAIFDPSGKLNIDLLWDSDDVPEYSAFRTSDLDPDLLGQWLDCRTVTEYILNAPSPKSAFKSAVSFFGMLGIKGGFPVVSECMDSVRWERAK